jgi:hypothetical protein
MTLSLVVTGAFLLQGCAAGAWVAAMAVNTMKSSHIRFGRLSNRGWPHRIDRAMRCATQR